jgi:hypothetical protein
LRPSGGAGRQARSRHWLGKYAAGAVLAGCLLASGGRSVAGHSVGHYPSYYPDEIRIDVMDTATAGRGLVEETLHAYIGARPAFSTPLPEHVRPRQSLSGFLVVSFNPASQRFSGAKQRCATAGSVAAALARTPGPTFVVHPYPVTPYHADYLHHLDRVEAATAMVGENRASAASIDIGAKGRLAEDIVRERWGGAATASDTVLEVTTLDDLLGAVPLSSTPGLPWIREGWHHAYRLLAPALDGEQRRTVDGLHARLTRGELRGGVAEAADLERRLIAALTQDCRRVVVGYTLREEFVSERYPAGIENVAFDSLDGLSSPVFIRTVKLKEYPWNGKTRLGVRESATAAWNPVGGFTDPMGRLIWSAIGDPAMIAFPFNASWMPNRVQAEVTKLEHRSGGFRVPVDALRPRPGGGLLQHVGPRTFAAERVVYDVLASPFEDGTEMGVADILYPLVFTYRWGAPADASGAHEPRLRAVFEAMHDRLVGLKILRIDETKHAVSEGLTVTTKTPVLEVYLKDAPGDERQVAALAPPWSSVPWHLLVLMEEAVARNYAAFSHEEAAKRGVPWLDLVRDPALRTKLQSLATAFEKEGYRPGALAHLVTAEDAAARWRALAAFAAKNGHFLIANGPYRLKQWTPDSVVLEAVREMTYPLGFGTFDRFVNPPAAVIHTATQDRGVIVVRADAEMLLKAGRQYRLTKEPLLRTTARGVQGLLVVSRYLLIDPDGTVLKADKMHWREDGSFAIELPERLLPGRYTVIAGIFLDGNALLPSAKVLHVDIGPTGSPG